MAIPVLCYVDGCFAYFTTQPLEKQWGDDWSDSPYEHNAGKPYGPCWHNEPKFRYGEMRGRVAPGGICQERCCKDDWNADGTPKWEIVKLAWVGPFELPCGDGGGNSQFSVQDINAGAIAWLRTRNVNPEVVIAAGATIREFIDKVHSVGGNVYMAIPK